MSVPSACGVPTARRTRKRGDRKASRSQSVSRLKRRALVGCEHAVFKPEEWLFQEVTGRLECGRDAQLRQEVSPLWGNDGVWLVLADEEQEAHGLQRLRDRNVFDK